MEVPELIIFTKNDNKEITLMAFELENNGINYQCDMSMVNGDKIKFIIFDKKINLINMNKNLVYQIL